MVDGCGSHGRESSPRMRGSRTVRLLRRNRQRIIPAHAGLTIGAFSSASGKGIIPAYAGLTSAARTVRSRPLDHPRACGAHFLQLTVLPFPVGSSPRMRGSLTPYVKRTLASRIIPAHAGLTSGKRYLSPPSRDHPRACGAHRAIRTRSKFCQGSSPRMRGSLKMWLADDDGNGIIPAYAGLTDS